MAMRGLCAMSASLPRGNGADPGRRSFRAKRVLDAPPSSRLTGVPTALIIQHEPDGPAGLAADRLAHHNFELHTLQVLSAGSTHSDVEFPDPVGYDLVVSTGSVHSVYDTAAIGSWIGREIAMLHRAHEADVPVFGICFGAQALCVALGGAVEPAPEFEIGWVDVETDDDDVVPSGPWFTWHGDRCCLPPSIPAIARSPIAAQAFRAGQSMAVQFHPEAHRTLVEGWLAKCSDEYLREHHIDVHEVLDGFSRHGAVAESNLHTMLDGFIEDGAR
jgi:GMP synthase-like glutamine amidotransferase